VVNSRPQRRSNQVWRRRQCQECGATFTTEERPQYGLVWQVRGPASALRPFSRPKLFLSLYKSCEHRGSALSDAESLTETVIARLSPLVQDGTLDRRDIRRVIMVALNRFDKTASVHYQAFHKG
jgi:transcriptional repressor NrdR